MYSRNSKTLKIIDFGSAIFYDNSSMVERKRIGTVNNSLIFSHITSLLKFYIVCIIKSAIFGPLA